MDRKGSTVLIVGILIAVLIIGIFSYFIFFQEEEKTQEQSEQNSGTSQNEQSQICVEDWDCSGWSECVDSQQTRTCTDLKSCGTIENKPSETQTCTEEIAQCAENWNCSSWYTCTNNQQTRTCTDSNNCGTINNKPSVSQTCEEETGACGDGSCNFPEENVYSCWQDCKPDFNTGNFEASITSPKSCSGSPAEPGCCATEAQYTQYDSYYTCDYIGGCENDFTFCTTKCNEAGYDKPTVVGYTFDIETGEDTGTKTFIQCSCKAC